MKLFKFILVLGVPAVLAVWLYNNTEGYWYFFVPILYFFLVGYLISIFGKDSKPIDWNDGVEIKKGNLDDIFPGLGI